MMYFTISAVGKPNVSVMQFYDEGGDDVATIALPVGAEALVDFYLKDERQTRLWGPIDASQEPAKIILAATSPGTVTPMFRSRPLYGSARSAGNEPVRHGPNGDGTSWQAP